MVPTARIFTLTSRSGVWPEVLPLWYKFWSSSARWVSQFWLVFPWSGVFGVFLGATLPLWFLHQSHPSNSSLFQLSRVTHPLGLGPSGRNFLRSPIWFCPSFFRLLFSLFFQCFAASFWIQWLLINRRPLSSMPMVWWQPSLPTFWYKCCLRTWTVKRWGLFSSSPAAASVLHFRVWNI